MNLDVVALRLDEIIAEARRAHASDIHLTAGRAHVLRIDGRLTFPDSHAWHDAEIHAVLEILLAEAAARGSATATDVTATLRRANAGTVRVHAYRTFGGTALALRLLPDRAPTLEQLGMPPVVEQLAERANGMVVFAGPTGCGKTTAMAALLESINRTRPAHILTIEDPIEYRIGPGFAVVNQREVGSDAASFRDAVVSALRSDPDVVMIGEMRDADTMRSSLTAAETGHLVFTTLHTADSVQTIERIAGSFDGSMQPEVRTRLAQTLAAVVCLRLIPRAHGQGRVTAAEILIVNDAVKSLIRDGKAHQLRNVIATSRHCGMQTLESHLSDLIACGAITADAARAAAPHPSDLRPESRPAS